MSESLCFARRHMPAAIESFHGYCLAVSRKSGVFYSDARRDARDFGISKNTVTVWTRFLEERGWIERLTKGKRLKRNKTSGQYQSIPYKVRNHDEWAQIHPGFCRILGPKSAPVPVLSADESKKTKGLRLNQKRKKPPVPILEAACPNSRVSPVPKIGTKTEKNYRQEKIDKKRSVSTLSPSDFESLYDIPAEIFLDVWPCPAIEQEAWFWLDHVRYRLGDALCLRNMWAALWAEKLANPDSKTDTTLDERLERTQEAESNVSKCETLVEQAVVCFEAKGFTMSRYHENSSLRLYSTKQVFDSAHTY